MCEGYFNISIPSKGFGCALFDTVILLFEKGIFVAFGICEFGKPRGFLRKFFFLCSEKYYLHFILWFHSAFSLWWKKAVDNGVFFPHFISLFLGKLE